jgi:hypothetical protein
MAEASSVERCTSYGIGGAGNLRMFARILEALFAVCPPVIVS